MQRIFYWGVLVIWLAACGSDSSGESDLYFASGDAVLMPNGDGTGGVPTDTSGQDGEAEPDGGVDSDNVLPDGKCQPDCTNKTCGSDGCGGECGACPEDYHCDANFICTHDICVPQCDDKECGDDGCVGVCGTCPLGHDCLAGQCSCEPDCFGKDCGPDGCGGNCGECGGGLDCDAGKCICIADCNGKECGDDGCGESCGSCTAPKSCNGLGQCENLSCQTQGTLVCNTSIPGDTTGLSNNFDSYGCGFDASGPEALYQFAAETPTYIQVELEEPGASKHNVYVIKGDCNPNVCVENDFDTVSWTAQPGESFIYSVDGYQATFGTFTLHVTCIDAGNCPYGKIPGCNDGQCQWGHWLGDDMCTKEFDCEEMNFDNGDCE